MSQPIIYLLIITNVIWLGIILNYRKKVKNKLNYMDNILIKVSQGDLTHKIDSKDISVLGPLYENLNNLIMKFRNLLAQIITMSDKTLHFTSELNEDTMKVSDSSRKLLK